MFWSFSIWINCFSDLKIFANSWPSASNFQKFFSITRAIFLTLGQNNFGNKIPIIQAHLEKKTFVFNFSINVLNWLVKIKYSYEKVQWLIFRFLEWQIHFFLIYNSILEPISPKTLYEVRCICQTYLKLTLHQNQWLYT